MRRELILIAFTTLTSLSVYAQISGVVVDSHSQPLSYANVSLYSLPDSTLISGTITNADGQFSFDHANSTGHECLKISAIGYITAFVSPVKSKQTVQMQSNEYALKEVVVSGKRDIFKSRGTDIIADIQHSRLRDFGFADDILDKLPMVSGEKGNYQVFGKGTAVIYVGNRKLIDPSELSRIATKDIATIEVISNPGAKYDADTHAVIKINLKNQHAKGLGGMVAARDGQGRRNYDYEQTQFTYNTDKVNAFAVFSNSTSRYSTDQENTETTFTPKHVWSLYSNMPKWLSTYYDQTVSGGMSVNIDKNDTVGGQVSYQKETEHYGGESDNLISRDAVLYERMKSAINARSHYDQWQSNLYYEGRIASNWTLDFNGDYLRRTSHEGRNNAESGNLTTSHDVQSTNKTTYDIAAALVELEYQLCKNAKLRVGSNVSYVKDVKTYNSQDDTSTSTNTALTSEETKTAFFAEGNMTLGKLSADAGVRYERLKMSYHDDLNHQYLVDRSYTRLYPYLSMSMPVCNSKMGLSLTTKVQRPSYYQLRNSHEYFNKYETEAGNPMLLSQYTTDLSYSIQYRHLRFSLAYQWIKDYIMTNNVVDQEDPLHLLSIPQNKPLYSALDGYLSYNNTVGIWEFYANLNVMRTFFDIYNTDGTLANGKRPYGVLSFNNYFNLKNQWMPYLWLTYNTDGYMREYRVKQGFVVSFGVTKYFFKKAVFARLSVNNILGTKERETRYASDYIFEKERFKDNRNISLFIRYTFNNKKKYNGKSAASEEIDRM